MFIYICWLGWFIFTKSIEFIHLMNCFRFLLVNSLLLAGQLPTLSTLFFKLSLSFFSQWHWNIRWSTDSQHLTNTLKFLRIKFYTNLLAGIINNLRFSLQFISFRPVHQRNEISHYILYDSVKYSRRFCHPYRQCVQNTFLHKLPDKKSDTFRKLHNFEFDLKTWKFKT